MVECIKQADESKMEGLLREGVHKEESSGGALGYLPGVETGPPRDFPLSPTDRFPDQTEVLNTGDCILPMSECPKASFLLSYKEYP